MLRPLLRTPKASAPLDETPAAITAPLVARHSSTAAIVPAPETARATFAGEYSSPSGRASGACACAAGTGHALGHRFVDDLRGDSTVHRLTVGFDTVTANLRPSALAATD